VLVTADLVGVRQEARPEPQGRTAGARRPRPTLFHRQAAQRTVADRLRRFAPPKPSPPPAKARSTCARSRTCTRAGSWATGSTPPMKTTLAVSALNNAVALRDPAGTIVHPDPGSQFRSKKFVKALRRNGLVGSTGRVGACGDNAAMEYFFALLQKNVPDRQRWAGHPRGATPGDRDVDRTHLPPQTSSTRPRPAHPDRV
jgi:transposase InsO family protein